MRRLPTVLLLAVFLPGSPATATAGSASATTTEPEHSARRRAAIEVACGYDGAQVTRSIGEAGPKGVTVRFFHPEGQWTMSWKGGLPRPFFSSGSAMVAEVTMSIPPGPVPIVCMPIDADSHDPRWWVDAQVQDPRGHWRPIRPDCTALVGTAWHGPRRPPAQERDVVIEALDGISIEVAERDHLGRIAYPRQVPRVWGLHRDGALIALVTMMEPDRDGWVVPSSASGCSQHGQPSAQ